MNRDEVLEAIETLNAHKEALAVSFSKRAALYSFDLAITALQAQLNDGWISVEDDMPKEHDSIFAKLYGTEKWNNKMRRKVSDEVNVCGVYPDGKKFVTHSKTHDGNWGLSSIFQMTVTHWMPLPQPPKQDKQ